MIGVKSRGFCWVCAIAALFCLRWVRAQESAESARSRHWSFQAIQRPAVPTLRNKDWPQNPIDNFVLGKLESLGIEPSGPADRTTLIRRLSLDLLGLPPEPQGVDRFVADTSPSAYDDLVSRLLESPHFGERWGRHWLDLARYADSDGYEKDSPRPYAYLYRDWVIESINRDLPFDQFTIDQLAGDLLPDSVNRPESRALSRQIATGFHRNTLTNKEGGVDQEEFRNKANVDRVNTTATVWLGLTLGCCECHNHKYDPFTQKEYYSFFAFFNRSIEAEIAAPQPAETAAYDQAKAAFDKELAKYSSAIAQFEKEQLPEHEAAWERSLGGKTPASRWTTIDPISATSAGGATLAQLPDGSIQVAGKSPAADSYSIEARTSLPGITAIRLEVLPVSGHPANGPGRVKHGNFVLNEFTVKAVPVGGGEPRPIVLQNATADFSQASFPVTGAVDGNPGTGWAIAPQFGQRHAAVFEVKDMSEGASGPVTLLFNLDQQFGSEHTIGRFRISVSAAPRPVPPDDIPDEVIAALGTPRELRDENQAKAVTRYFRTIDPDWKKLTAALADHSKKAPPAPSTRAMTLAMNSNPPATHVHIRGDFLRKGDAVEPSTPAVLPVLQVARTDSGATAAEPPAANRLDLARWLVDPNNPLTARVTVNRIWQYLFGKGLVATPNDFGTRGELPSHPELLDWLASEFAAPSVRVHQKNANGAPGEHDRVPWSLKDMIRLIVSSRTYQQSSNARLDLIDRDPTNTLLARQNRYRLEAEVVRDLYLAASGLLSGTVGGPSVRPPQPAGVSDLTYAGSAKWVESTGGDRYRRGMYTWFQRTSPYPMLTTFDSPDGVNCTVRRERSNTPLQALTLLNDVVFIECAQALARRTLSEAPSADPSARLRHMFSVCMSRGPTDAETARLAELYSELLATCRARADAAEQLAGSTRPEGIDIAEFAAWVASARTMVNLDEFVTRD